MPGALGSGGAREGAGRPHKPIEEKILVGTATLAERRAFEAGLPEVPPRSGGGQAGVKRTSRAVPKPEGLTVREGQIWDELAPHAMAAYTLTPASARSFRSLIETIVEVETLWKTLRKDGWRLTVRRPGKNGKPGTTVKVVHPLLKPYQMLKRDETLGLHAFKLRASTMDFIPAVEPDADPWAEFDAPSADPQ